jgi:hypothetical protein
MTVIENLTSLVNLRLGSVVITLLRSLNSDLIIKILKTNMKKKGNIALLSMSIFKIVFPELSSLQLYLIELDKLVLLLRSFVLVNKTEW